MKGAAYKEVLFICTGNFYRSRFAEAVFNHEARRLGLPWRAFSRGLAIHLVTSPLSPITIAALEERGIALDCTGPDRCPLTEADLRRAARRIALKEEEHRPYFARLFPAWEHRVQYWHFHDRDVAPPEVVLPRIEKRVRKLISKLTKAAKVL